MPNSPYLLNTVYQDGKCIGSGTCSEDGFENFDGHALIAWNGSKLKFYDNVLNDNDSNVPKTSGTWAQGGYDLYLCDSNWKTKFFAQHDAEGIRSAAARTGVLINESTGYVYLFATRYNSLIDELRREMMYYAGITDGGSSGSWKAICTDGGHSTQLRCGEGSTQAFPCTKVPQIISLKNKT